MIRKMRKLPGRAKVVAIQMLACHESPTTVVRVLGEEFGIVVSPQNCEAYDPTRSNGRALSANLVELFWDIRKRFYAEIENIGIAHLSVRLRKLDRMSQLAEDMGNLPLAKKLLEQAAIECGRANLRAAAPMRARANV